MSPWFRQTHHSARFFLIFDRIDSGAHTVAAFSLQQVAGPFGTHSRVVGSATHRWRDLRPSSLDPGNTLQIVMPPLPSGRFTFSILAIHYGGSGESCIDQRGSHRPRTARTPASSGCTWSRTGSGGGRRSHLPLDTPAPSLADFWVSAEYAHASAAPRTPALSVSAIRNLAPTARSKASITGPTTQAGLATLRTPERQVLSRVSSTAWRLVRAVRRTWSTLACTDFWLRGGSFP